MDIPTIALSVRQPWAWAIVSAGKDVENRTTFAVTKARFDPRPIAVHASKGMTREEYEDAAEFMASIGVTCPHPSELVRGAIIGAATVTAVTKQSTSRWFFGPRGLLLADAAALPQPIPCAGQLGYFEWRPAGTAAPILPWMQSWPKNRPGHTPRTAPASLFDGTEV